MNSKNFKGEGDGAPAYPTLMLKSVFGELVRKAQRSGLVSLPRICGAETLFLSLTPWAVTIARDMGCTSSELLRFYVWDFTGPFEPTDITMLI
ncbi:hypothetical protein PTKIN_Ptkin10aG0079200 [Pterospermum kingtungense]